MGSARPVLLRGAEEAARADHGAHALRGAAEPLAGDPAADRLRRPRQDPVQDRSRALGRRPERVPGHLLPSRPLLPEAGAHACGRGRAGARDRLRHRLFRHAGGFARPTSCRTIPASPASASRRPATASSTGRRTTGSPSSAPPISAPSASSTSTASRPAGLPSTSAVFGKTEEFPDFTHVYFETPQAGLGHGHGLCPARRAERRRRLPLRHAARPRRSIMDIESDALHAPGRQPPRHRAADLDVLVLGDGEAHRRRLAAGDPRFRRARALDRHRRAHLAPAQQPAAHHHLGLRRREPEGLRPAAARPELRPLPRRRLLRPPAVPLDRAAGRLGPGRDPARRDPDRRRDPRQHRRHVGAGGAGARRHRRSTSATACTGRPTSPIRPRSPASSPPASAMAGRPARPARRACASSWSSSWASP